MTKAYLGITAAWLVLTACLPDVAQAQEFRVLNTIPAPERLPEGAKAVERFEPVDRSLIESAVRKLAATWNTGDIEKMLDEDFYDRQRLGDNLMTYLQRDAKLKVLSVQGQQTLQQYEQDGRRVSTVSVVVNTQIEFNHPTAGYQRFPGRTELVFEVKQSI